MQCADKNKIMDYIEGRVTEKRRIHTYAVAEEAKKLAKRHGEDMEKAEIAALFHDSCRDLGIDELNGYIRRFGLDPAYFNNANLAHSKIAACVMEEDFHIKDRDIIHAVRYPTTGRADMSRLEKILYLADAIEPNRNYDGVEKLRELAYQDLDEACLYALEQSIQYVKRKGERLDEDTVKARDSLIEQKTRKDNDK